MTHAEIIAALGGAKAVADALGIKNPNTVLYWTREGRRIPSHWWAALCGLEGASDHGVTLERLALGAAKVTA
jgi:hypothetical protein